MPTKKCLNCDKEFHVQLHRLERTKYCSKQCMTTHRCKIKKCLNCNKEFHVKLSLINRTKYCSKNCSETHKGGVNKKCLNCDKEFYVQKSKIEQTKFCSRKCMDLQKAGITKKCLTCNKEFYVVLNRVERAKYCSNKCVKSGTIKKCLICNKEFYVKKGRINDRKYCSRKCHAKDKKGKEPSNTFWKYATEKERKKRLLKIYNKHVIRKEAGCWGWNGSPHNGYGSIKYNGKFIGAHVASYIISKGDIPKGMFILHSCDNKICSNPDHLRAGTAKENTKDMFDRHRNPSFRGESNGASKLKECDVIKIRKLLSKGIKQLEIAQKYKVSKSIISLIKLNKKWAYLNENHK